MRLRQRWFLTLLGIGVLPLLFLLLVVLEHVARDLEQRTGVELQKTLAKMSQEIRTLMDHQQAVVQGLAKVPVVRDFASVVASEDQMLYDTRAARLADFFLNYQSTVPSIQAMRFTDMRGRTLVKVKEGAQVPIKHRDTQAAFPYVEDISYKTFFRRALMSPGRTVSVSDFERGKVAGEVDFCPAMVRYSVVLQDELEEPAGILIVNMWGRRLDDVVEAALGGFPGNAYMVEINPADPDRDGIYLYHRDPDRRFANQLGTGYRLPLEIGAAAWQRIREGAKTGVLWVDGDRGLFYRRYRPFPDRATEWLLVVEADRAAVLEPIARLRGWITWLIGGVLVFGLLLARWAAARMAGPVQDLARVITRFADGDGEARWSSRRRDEVADAGRAFNALADSLDKARRDRDRAVQAACQSERLAATGQLAAGVAHEINNPLMNIMSLAALVEESLPADATQLREDLQALQREGRRCARIVQGMLDFSRPAEPRIERFSFRDLFTDTAALLQHQSRKRDLSLVVEMDDPLVLEGDRDQLQQVLVNVLLNAFQASPDGGRILARGEREPEGIRVEVLDEGSGVAPEHLGKVFNPFFTTRPEGGGTGLGLAVSYGIVRRHGGSITIENRPRGGARVVIRLPLQPAAPSRETEPVSAGPDVMELADAR